MKTRSSMAYVASALAALIASAPIPAYPAAPKPDQPYALVETSNLTNGNSRARVIVHTVPSGVTSYQIVVAKANGAVAKTIRSCTKASMRNGSGSSGCYADIKANTNNLWGIRAKSTGGWGRVSLFAANDLRVMSMGKDKLDLGTRQNFFVGPTKAMLTAYANEIEKVVKAQAAGCAKDKSIQANIKKIRDSAARSVLTSRTPVSAAVKGGAAIIAAQVAKTNGKFADRCKPIALFTTEFAKVAASAVKNRRVEGYFVGSGYLTDTTWSLTDPTAFDFCVLVVGSRHETMRLTKAGGPNKAQCKAYWGSMVS